MRAAPGLAGEPYFNCPACGVGIPRWAGRCFACGQVFHLRRVQDAYEITLHFVSMESLGQTGNLYFVHLESETGTMTYLTRTTKGYDLVTLAPGPLPNPAPLPGG